MVIKPTATVLREHEAHIWYVHTAACDSPEQRAAYRLLLAPDELKRLDRFVFDHLKLEYLATRALCRTMLSAFEPGVRPEQWRFTTNAYGKPEIDAGMLTSSLRFNLSNTRNIVACAVTHSTDVGIDVENITRIGDFEGVVTSYFSPKERRSFYALPSEQWRDRFFTLWTLKEAYIKARGVGLSIDLDLFSFDLSGESITVSFDPRALDDTRDWQFSSLELDAYHRMAIAIRSASTPFTIWVREVVLEQVHADCAQT
ncbi:4'-phosphopantetheinyl transferase superfamily protein [Mycetohabitans sp. B8]|uniref:4'-phosphopantetheinyl transferase superfamily protein n=1 Tax=Burkholderia sp. B8(2020) TaxID=2713619 RepID=A0A6G6CX16_9BURK|nr:4'-phosphopantetheinyl transferase superfamily protein [Mycetohabitans sp. B8]MCG1043595.1 4'-phosphopantetheinyl transferase superfamily protein [Mycetohabitans sp. B8]QIE07369.1 4'-phosphopantetheinyl transferase superfamily protein [Burkholderia sp. B8(2020)]